MHTTPGTFPAHEGFPNRGPCSLSSQEGGPHSWAPRPPLGMEGFPPRAVCPHSRERSPFAGRALNGTRRSPDPRCACPETRTDSSLLAGQVSPTAHAVVPATGLCALNRRQRRPHSRAARSQAHTEVSPLDAAGLSWAWRDPDMYYPFHARPGKRTDGSQLAARCPHLHTKGFPPTGRVPSTVHAVVPTTRLCAFNHSPSGSHSQAVSPQAHREGSHSRATHHQPRTDGSSRL